MALRGIRADGAIVVVGHAVEIAPSEPDPFDPVTIVRIPSTGVAPNLMMTDDFRIEQATVGGDSPGTVVFQPDGKIVLTGYLNNRYPEWLNAIERFSVNGAFDPAFNPEGSPPGIVITPNSSPQILQLVESGRENDGEIVMEGHLSGQAVVSSFGPTGTENGTENLGSFDAGSIAVAPAGTIEVAGRGAAGAQEGVVVSGISEPPPPPLIECEEPDGAWHTTNITLHCTASSPESQLANPEQVSFTLTTAVASGGRTEEASTNRVEVCDTQGRCSTAGPITDLKVNLASPPVVTAVRPRTGPTAGGTDLTITGAHLASASMVRVGATEVPFTAVSEGTLTTVTPPATTGTVDVTVTTPYGTSETRLSDQFTYGVPTVTGISPNEGPVAGGTSVTITGSGFATGTTMTTFKFGKTDTTNVECATTTACTMLTPPGKPGTVQVKATVDGRSSAASGSASEYTYR